MTTTAPRTTAPRATAAARARRPGGRPLSSSVMSAVELMSPALLTRRAIALLVMTLLLPGLAQVSAGNRRLGRLGLRIWVAVLATSALLAVGYLVDRRIVFWLVTQGWFLFLLMVALAAGALVWLALFWDAWRLGRPPLQPLRARRIIAALAAALVLMTSGPLAFAAHQVSVGRDLLGSVFGGNPTSVTAGGRYNILLLGGDAGKDRIGTRPDSVTLVSIDQQSAHAVMFSFPRNLENIPFPAGSPAAKALPKGFSCGDECLLNAVYQYGEQHPDLFTAGRDPGAEAMKQAVSAISGLKVNYYVLIDLAGFRDLVDAMGGITLTVERRIPIGGGTSRVSGYIKPGRQSLDGFHALWYARSRHGSSDYDRMARQRCVMTAMLHQLDPQTVLTKFQAIAGASSKVVSTDIPQSDLGTFIDLALKAKADPNVRSVQFVPPLIRPAYPDFGLIRRTVASALKPPQSTKSDAASAAEKGTATTKSSQGSATTAAAGKPAAPGTAVDADSRCQPG